MSDRFSIEMPERVELGFELAGVGSRFCAAAIDSTLIIIPSAFISLLIANSLRLGGVGSWIAAFLILVNFAAVWGYYILFELAWNGQTPGKRALGLRVVRSDGYPVSFPEILIRNLIRPVDFLPFFYGVGFLSMMLDGKWRRLGDLAAGTVVIKERRWKGAELVARPVIQREELRYADLIRPEEVTEGELSAIREYIRRRASLEPDARRRVARRIAAPILRKMGVPGSMSIDYDRFLEEILALKADLTPPDRRG
ncbi:RDD family protein [Candidatus Poribacteria bacterium]|nr:MAG: RDD family protein [Candidatus Poribacteria bacterium]